LDLHEYQGKELFRRYGIPVSDGLPALSSAETRAAGEAVRVPAHPEHVHAWFEGLRRNAVEPGGRGDHDLHPMQEAWLERDVAQCGYCQPGQIMAAVALVKRVKAEGRTVSEADLDAIRNICRCGTYTRIREAIRDGASRM